MYVRDRNRRLEEGWMGADLNFFRNSIRRPISQNHPSPQAFWPKFGIAMEKLNQHKRPRTGEQRLRSKSESNRENSSPVCLDWSDRCNGPVWPIGAWTRLDRSDRSCCPVWLVGTQKNSWTSLQTTNLEQIAFKFNETRRKASFLPQERIPKRSHPKDIHSTRILGWDQKGWVFSRTQEIEFERGFRTGLETRESQQRTRGTIAIVCTKNETKIHHKRAQKRWDWIDSKV